MLVEAGYSNDKCSASRRLCRTVCSREATAASTSNRIRKLNGRRAAERDVGLAGGRARSTGARSWSGAMLCSLFKLTSLKPMLPLEGALQS